jgi:hypothetical protein
VHFLSNCKLKRKEKKNNLGKYQYNNSNIHATLLCLHADMCKTKTEAYYIIGYN